MLNLSENPKKDATGGSGLKISKKLNADITVDLKAQWENDYRYNMKI